MAFGPSSTRNSAANFFSHGLNRSVRCKSSSALPCFGFENNVSQVMKNVLDAFQKPGSLPGGAWNQEEKSWT